MKRSGNSTHSIDDRITIEFDWSDWYCPETLETPEEYDFEFEITGVSSDIVSKTYKPSKLVLKMLYDIIDDSDIIESIIE